MIAKLRRKFVAIIVSMVAAVLLVTLTIVLAINYNQNVSQTQEILHSEILETINSNGFKQIPRVGRQDKIPVVVFVMSNDGYIYLPNESISEEIISNEFFKNISPMLVKANYGFGTISQFRICYEKERIGQNTYIAVTDDHITKEFEDILWLLLPLMILALLIIFIISIFISKWAVKPIEENLEQQKHFIANASHDLKTPITVMMANNSILFENEDKTIKSQKQWIESNKNETNRLLMLVNSMLDLIKSETHTNGETEKINLSEIVNACVLSFESLAYDKKIKFVSEIDDDIFIVANKDDIEKLIATLIENAFKHAAIDDTISVTLRGKKLSINNKLTYIDEDDLAHIFDRFYMADKSRENKDNKQSHGLGLAIAAELAKNNKAKIYATSNKQNGTSFTVSF